jgi:hypothetical protein
LLFCGSSQGRAGKIRDPVRTSKIGPCLTRKIELVNNKNVVIIFYGAIWYITNHIYSTVLHSVYLNNIFLLVFPGMKSCSTSISATSTRREVFKLIWLPCLFWAEFDFLVYTLQVDNRIFLE